MTAASDQRLAAAVTHHRAGRIDEAEKLYREILRAEPRHHNALLYLGLIALSRKDTVSAVAHMRLAVAASPLAAICHYNLGLALRQHGDRPAAIASYREAVRLMPNVPEMLFELGSVLREDGDARAAVEYLKRAVDRRADYAEAHLNLGAAQLVLGETDRAEASLLRVLELNPQLNDAHVLLGNLYRQAGRLDAAASAYRRALEAQPGNAVVLLNLGNVLQAQGRLDDAASAFEQAHVAAPDNAEVCNNLGNVRFLQGNHAVAIEWYQRALALKPNYGHASNNLGAALQKIGRIEEAMTAYRAVLSDQPEPDAHNNLGLALAIFGNYREAYEQFRRAISLRPDFSIAHRNLLGTLFYDPGASLAERWAAHEAFGRAMELGVVPHPPRARSRDPDRRIRVGYVSADFSDHPVARNVTPLLEHRDRGSIDVVAYAEVARPDSTTERLKGFVDLWRPTLGLSDAQVADQVRADDIDILVLMAGHFDHNRLQIAAYRSAPVQVSFHDPGTSGMAAMDYLIADRVLAPRNGLERFSERVVRVPSFYIHAPLTEAPPVGPLPATAAGHVTFGSFNNPAKINDAVLQLWGEVLRNVPGSRLTLKFKNWFGNERLRDRVLKGAGVEEERIEFQVGDVAAGQHLNLYNRIDIALDSFPFTGSTTTFEALWMGVPVVTLLGETMVGRWSGSMLRSLKREDLIGRSPDEYVRIASGLAGDLDRLATLRRSLRDRVAASPLCDGRARARQIDRLYRALWRRWCAQA